MERMRIVTDNTKVNENLLKRVKELEEENKTLKDNVEFLHSCLDDRDKSIAIMQEENKKLKEGNENLEEINQKLLRDLDTVEEIKDRERIGLRERIEELEQELKDERVKNKILRMKK